jgi:hypothetical protein
MLGKSKAVKTLSHKKLFHKAQHSLTALPWQHLQQHTSKTLSHKEQIPQQHNNGNG